MNVKTNEGPLRNGGSHRRGSNAESTQKENRALILGMIRNGGSMTRTELATKSKLQQATITIIMNEFLNSGLVQKSGFVDGNNGRRVMSFSLCEKRFCTIGVRMSVSYIAVAAYDIAGNCFWVKKVFYNTMKNLETTCMQIVAIINKNIFPVLEGRRILGVGVGVEGPCFIKDAKYVYPSENGSVFDIGECLSNLLRLPVAVNRAVSFAGYCAWNKLQKSSEDCELMVFVSISYSVECSVVYRGEIVHGLQGLAGQLGELELEDDGGAFRLKDVAASESVLRQVRALLPDYPDSQLNEKKDDLNIRDVIHSYTAGDALAQRVYDRVAMAVGKALRQVILLLNPNAILVGDELPATDRMRDRVKEEMCKGLAPEIVAETELGVSVFARKTEADPHILGASRYMADIALSDISKLLHE